MKQARANAYEIDFASNPFQTSTGVSGRLTGTGTVREKGVYRRKEALWQDQTYNAPEADVTKSLKLLAEETLPGGPQDLSLDFATISGTIGVNNPFPGIVSVSTMILEQAQERTHPYDGSYLHHMTYRLNNSLKH